jgi:UDP-2-acetamido-2,6-beta-L-arabino-hexul-4-ose reductase
MKILVTGSQGFVARNLISELRNKGYTDILEYNRESDFVLLDKYTKECDFIFHLAGVNRPQNESEYLEGNYKFTSELLFLLKKHNNKSPILFSSSTQAKLDNSYGRSKKAGEDIIFSFSKETGSKALVYRLPNLFGKWCRPNYNSVVATFCYNVARDLYIQINDKNTELTLCYIDDLVEEFIRAINNNETSKDGYCYVPVTNQITLGELGDKLYSFKKNRDTLIMPSLNSDFDKALYATFLSYLAEDNFSYELKKNEDQRGWLAEFIKSDSMGQIFISKTKPGITRGNHWHHRKVEKFLVIQGDAVIKFRKIDTEQVLEYRVNGEKLEVVDIPVGYTHSITNIGNVEVITLFWACEIFNIEKPDTYYLEV